MKLSFLFYVLFNNISVYVLCVEFKQFEARLDLENKLVDAPIAFEIANCRSRLECSAACLRNCYMFSYETNTSICRVYAGITSKNVQVTMDSNRTLVYYRRKICPAGMYRNESDCVSCPAGQYGYQQGCVSCPPNHYQIEAGQLSCNECLNTTEWRKGVTPDKTKCRTCYSGYNTYTEGDMTKVIKTISADQAWKCGQECDVVGCKLFTWRSVEQKCYLHSTNDWNWGVVYRSVIYFKNC